MTKKPNIVIDLDGTILEDSWPRLGDWMPGAKEALHELSKVSKVLVYTCRIAPVTPLGMERSPALVQAEINAIRELLDDAGLYTVEIHNKPWKPYGVAYVDNRAVRYSGTKNAWKRLTPQLLHSIGEYERALELGALEYVYDGAGDNE